MTKPAAARCTLMGLAGGIDGKCHRGRIISGRSPVIKDDIGFATGGVIRIALQVMESAPA